MIGTASIGKGEARRSRAWKCKGKAWQSMEMQGLCRAKRGRDEQRHGQAKYALSCVDGHGEGMV